MSSAKFKDIFEFQTKSKNQAGEGLSEGEYPFYTSSQQLSKYLNTFQFKNESLVFGTGGNANVHLTTTPFSTSTDCLVATLRTNVGKQFNIKFVYFYLLGNISILERGFKGAGLKHISKDYISNIDIPILSIEKQEMLVKKFLLSDNLCTARKKSITLVDKYIKAIFIELFGDTVSNPMKWDTYNLKDLAEVKTGPFGSLLHKHDYVIGGIPLINPTHIIDNKIVIDNRLTVGHSKYKELQAYTLREGDIVLGRRGEIGRCALVTKDEDKYLCGTGSMYIRPNNSINSTYLLYLISNPSFKKLLESKAIGITMKNLSAGIVGQTRIILPPKIIQLEFELKVKQANILKENMITQLNLYNKQFQALSKDLLKCYSN